jgi:predicted permease
MACPTAVVSYIMAREMEGDAPLAGAIILGTTALSLATLVGWLALLGPG